MGLKGNKEYILGLKQATVEATNDLTSDTLEKVQSFTPVLTGRLRDGYEMIPATPQAPTARIINNVPYHDYVNDGTPTRAPVGMIELGLAAVDKDMRKRLRKVSR